nr:IS5.IS1182 family transposase [Pseudomonas aeruginosa]
MGLGIDLGIFTSLAAEGNDDIAVVIGDLCQNSLTRGNRRIRKKSYAKLRKV